MAAELLAPAMVLTALPLTALSAFAETSGDFTYAVLSEADKTCAITSYTGTADSVTVPATLNGYAVTRIGSSAFAENTSLTDVTLSEGVVAIEEGAFYGRPALHTVYLPSTVQTLADFAFFFCTALTNISAASGNPNFVSDDGAFMPVAREKMRYFENKLLLFCEHCKKGLIFSKIWIK